MFGNRAAHPVADNIFSANIRAMGINMLRLLCSVVICRLKAHLILSFRSIIISIPIRLSEPSKPAILVVQGHLMLPRACLRCMDERLPASVDRRS